MIKKSNIFMIVYVVFLFISIIVANDESSSKIALAATLAGVFFAVSDMYLNPAQQMKKWLKKMQTSLSEMQTELLNYTDEEKSEEPQYDYMIQKIQSSGTLIEKHCKKNRMMQITGYISFAIGVLIFLFVITFYNTDSEQFAFLLKFEKTITIFAFAMVVCNYIIQDIFLESIEKDMEAFEQTEEGNQ